MTISCGERGVLSFKVVSSSNFCLMIARALSTGTLMNRAETSYDLNSSSGANLKIAYLLSKGCRVFHMMLCLLYHR